MQDCNPTLALHYTAHHNWSWVVQSAVSFLNPEPRAVTVHNLSREMPSMKHWTRKIKPRYALFRIETSSDQSSWRGVWASSPALEYLDAKDALWEELRRVGAESAMPTTLLIPWDCDVEPQFTFDPSQYILKAALGSGGYGLYFISSPGDILSIVRNHADKARRTEGFCEGLLRDYGRVPSWSLQTRVSSLEVLGGRKCQFRAYIVLRNTSMFIYKVCEVRLPFWDTSIEEPLREDEAFFCGGSGAIPYNFQRRKVSTERRLVRELPEIAGIEDSLLQVMRRAFSALKEPILSKLASRWSGPEVSDRAEMAIAGVDLMVDKDFSVYIVELNNNPAMPAPDKNMSEAYRSHLSILVRDMIQVGLTGHTDLTSFQELW
jgi:hypothetical protein